MTGKYELLRSRGVDEVEKKIDSLIVEFKEKLKKIEKEFPEAGIGDTATDEAIVSILYRVIHFGEDI